MEACCSRFTAAEGGARLAAAAATKNILAVEYASFIPVRLLYEKASQIRGSLSDGRKRSAYVTRASRVQVVGFELKILTDLTVVEAKEYGDVPDWPVTLETMEVIVCTAPVLMRILEQGILSIANINVMILDSCHMVYEDDNLKYIMQKYKQCDRDRPIILALTYPLFTANRKDIENPKDNAESKEISERDNNSASEVCETETEESQITNEHGVGKNEVDDSRIGVRDDKSVGEAEENKEIDITDDKIVKEDSNSKPIKIEQFDCTEIAIIEKNIAQEAVECKEIALKDGNIEKEQTDSTEIAIREGASEKRDEVINNKDAITKKMSTEVSRSEMEMGAYENLDDFDMYEKLEWKMEEMEQELCCQMDLAEDIDGGKRLSGAVTKPRELIIEYSGRPTNEDLSEEYVDLEKFMRGTIEDAMEFMDDHRHDPTEIYGDELYEEFSNIPDPTIEPKQMLRQFVYILEQLGPYAADKAAFSLLTKLEKLKIKIPYERHFLLLCLCTTVFVRIRGYADSVFSRYDNDWDRIRAFSTPKVLRFAEILELFQPPDFTKDIGCKVGVPCQLGPTEVTVDKGDSCKTDIDSKDIGAKDTGNCGNVNNIGIGDIDNDGSLSETNIVIDGASKQNIRTDNTTKMLNDIEQCDFTALGDRIQNSVNTYEANLKDIQDINLNFNTREHISELNIQNNMDINTKRDTNTGNTSSNMIDNTDIHNRNTVYINGDTNNESNGLHDSNKNTTSNNDTQQTEVQKYAPKYTSSSSSPTDVNRPHEIQNINITFNEVQIIPDIDVKSNEVHKDALNYTSSTPTDVNRPHEIQHITNMDVKSNEVQKGALNYTSGSPTDVNRPHEVQNIDVKSNEVQKGGLGFTRRAGHRVRGRTRVQRNNAARIQQLQLNPDALCGIVYVKEALMAKIMFMLIVDMSRCNRRLAYLCAQYCAGEPAAAAEPRETQRQGKKHEEVLKKFRMHECNLLLATSALEEGIDLPRCNLVLRWDVPPSYRSYGVCRGRARAARATAALLCSHSVATTDMLLHNLATYRELDQIISRKCGCGIQNEPPQSEEDQADIFTGLVKPYTPNDNTEMRCKNDKENNDKTAPSDVNDKENNDIVNDEESNEMSPRTDEVNDSNINDSISTQNEREVEYRNNMSKAEDTRVVMTNELRKETKNTIICDENNENGIMSRVNTKNDKNDASNDINDVCNESNQKQSIRSRVNTKNDATNDASNDECNESNLRMSENSASVTMDTHTQCDKCKNSYVCECFINQTDIDLNKKDINSNGSDIKKNITDSDSIASVDLNTAIALINRYCGKLPSDTFTRLAPQWWMEEVHLPVQGSSETRTAYICTIRLPLNCPVKYNIVGHPMPTKVLARRMVALQACRILHKSGELDNQLMPIGKENFKAADLEASSGVLSCGAAGDPADFHDTARPGTTKRRQYYYKRTAWAFTDCQPVEDADEIQPPGDQATPAPPPQIKEAKPGAKRNMLYAIVSKLCCALPERYNTRGRRLHAPQHASQAIGILMARHEPDNLQIPAFPVYTRSGEVRVSVEYVPGADVALTPRRAALVRRFMRFVFAEVLRVRRRGMKLQSEGSTHNNYYIVPTIKTTRDDGSKIIDIDWAFLELIYQHTEDKKQSEVDKPTLWQQNEEDGSLVVEEETKEKRKESVKKMENPLLKPGETFVFDAERYREAVVTPWYRNQDQPQFFLVAEICGNLTPDSAFPSATHSSFRDYYTSKYGVRLTQADQPLLDVDHTSARLNLLTPRYVNRKGVALPVSSERTRRAKRDRLDQKQILVPELCRVHPFAAPLWFATVALPCVLYRINALLIADEIRRAVAIDVGLGIPKISESTMPGFQWPPLDFGWSLAEVLNADSEKNDKKKEEEETKREQTEKEISSNIEEGKENKEEDGIPEEKTEKTINDILQEKEDAESGFEIGTWSNDMAAAIPPADEYDDYMEPLPPNLTFCTSASGGANWYDPIEKPKSQFNPSRTFSVADSDCSFISSDLDSDDSDLDFEGSDEDTDTSGFCSSKNSNAAMGVRIEYKTAHEAEAVDLECTKKVNPAPLPDPADDAEDRAAYERLIRSGTAPDVHIQKFRDSVARHKQEIISKGHLITQNEKITHFLPPTKGQSRPTHQTVTDQTIAQMFPYTTEQLTINHGQIDIESVERNKRVLLKQLKLSLPDGVARKMNCFSMVDIDIDSPGYVNEKLINVGFDAREKYEEDAGCESESVPYYEQRRGKEFDFDYQPNLQGHPGPSPSVILQALTMSNANDGINLERLETIGDSFLKFAITAYLYCAHPTVHEGKLSHMRSKQVSNLNLYRLGRSKRLGARMIASKFEPHDNWLPPCHKPPHTQHHSHVDTPDPSTNPGPSEATGCFIPYNLITQHSIPDKSIADCVEALIGAYLLECGPRGALLFMAWLGIRVLPCHRVRLRARRPAAAQKPPSPPSPKRQRSASTSSECSSSDEESGQRHEPLPDLDWSWPGRQVGSLRPYQDEHGNWIQPVFGELKAPPSPLLRYIEDPEGELDQMLSGYDALERTLQYRFKDRSLLLQAMTHASHHSNRLTDCYQRLEFLGDAILDYLITRHLYEDPRRHSPGALTDLRSALVNNTIFATLAARHGFHKYFRHMSPGLNEVLTKYVKIQEENGHSISEEHYLIQEDEMEQAEDVEVPKALGDLFESVAGAIFLDSGMSLDAVWRSYVTLMGAELEAFSAAAPKSPVRELLEAEPDTAKFGKPERLADGRRVRVCVEVFGRGAFKGVGRNYRIAKGTAARCALRHLRARRAR